MPRSRATTTTRAANRANWPGNYSIQYPVDLRGHSDKAAAIDLTMSDTQMRKRTDYLRDAVNRNDPRLAAVRSFYGTLDSRSVFGRIKNGRHAAWRTSTSDSSHLWHIHISVLRAYVNTWSELEPILSVLSGQKLGDWKPSKGGREMRLPRKGDSGEHVEIYQRILVALEFDTIDPRKDPKEWRYDGEYGPATQRAVANSRKAFGAQTTDVERITPWHHMRLYKALGRPDD